MSQVQKEPEVPPLAKSPGAASPLVKETVVGPRDRSSDDLAHLPSPGLSVASASASASAVSAAAIAGGGRHRRSNDFGSSHSQSVSAGASVVSQRHHSLSQQSQQSQHSQQSPPSQAHGMSMSDASGRCVVGTTYASGATPGATPGASTSAVSLLHSPSTGGGAFQRSRDLSLSPSASLPHPHHPPTQQQPQHHASSSSVDANSEAIVEAGDGMSGDRAIPMLRRPLSDRIGHGTKMSNTATTMATTVNDGSSSQAAPPLAERNLAGASHATQGSGPAIPTPNGSTSSGPSAPTVSDAPNRPVLPMMELAALSTQPIPAPYHPHSEKSNQSQPSGSCLLSPSAPAQARVDGAASPSRHGHRDDASPLSSLRPQTRTAEHLPNSEEADCENEGAGSPPRLTREVTAPPFVEGGPIESGARIATLAVSQLRSEPSTASSVAGTSSVSTAGLSGLAGVTQSPQGLAQQTAHLHPHARALTGALGGPLEDQTSCRVGQHGGRCDSIEVPSQTDDSRGVEGSHDHRHTGGSSGANAPKPPVEDNAGNPPAAVEQLDRSGRPLGYHAVGGDQSSKLGSSLGFVHILATSGNSARGGGGGGSVFAPPPLPETGPSNPSFGFTEECQNQTPSPFVSNPQSQPPRSFHTTTGGGYHNLPQQQRDFLGTTRDFPAGERRSTILSVRSRDATCADDDEDEDDEDDLRRILATNDSESIAGGDESNPSADLLRVGAHGVVDGSRLGEREGVEQGYAQTSQPRSAAMEERRVIIPPAFGAHAAPSRYTSAPPGSMSHTARSEAQMAMAGTLPSQVSDTAPEPRSIHVSDDRTPVVLHPQHHVVRASRPPGASCPPAASNESDSHHEPARNPEATSSDPGASPRGVVLHPQHHVVCASRAPAAVCEDDDRVNTSHGFDQAARGGPGPEIVNSSPVKSRSSRMSAALTHDAHEANVMSSGGGGGGGGAGGEQLLIPAPPSTTSSVDHRSPRHDLSPPTRDLRGAVVAASNASVASASVEDGRSSQQVLSPVSGHSGGRGAARDGNDDDVSVPNPSTLSIGSDSQRIVRSGGREQQQTPAEMSERLPDGSVTTLSSCPQGNAVSAIVALSRSVSAGSGLSAHPPSAHPPAVSASAHGPILSSLGNAGLGNGLGNLGVGSAGIGGGGAAGSNASGGSRSPRLNVLSMSASVTSAHPPAAPNTDPRGGHHHRLHHPRSSQHLTSGRHGLAERQFDQGLASIASQSHGGDRLGPPLRTSGQPTAFDPLHRNVGFGHGPNLGGLGGGLGGGLHAPRPPLFPSPSEERLIAERAMMGERLISRFSTDPSPNESPPPLPFEAPAFPANPSTSVDTPALSHENEKQGFHSRHGHQLDDHDHHHHLPPLQKGPATHHTGSVSPRESHPGPLPFSHQPSGQQPPAGPPPVAPVSGGDDGSPTRLRQLHQQSHGGGGGGGGTSSTATSSRPAPPQTQHDIGPPAPSKLGPRVGTTPQLQRSWMDGPAVFSNVNMASTATTAGASTSSGPPPGVGALGFSQMSSTGASPTPAGGTPAAGLSMAKDPTSQHSLPMSAGVVAPPQQQDGATNATSVENGSPHWKHGGPNSDVRSESPTVASNITSPSAVIAPHPPDAPYSPGSSLRSPPMALRPSLSPELRGLAVAATPGGAGCYPACGREMSSAYDSQLSQSGRSGAGGQSAMANLGISGGSGVVAGGFGSVSGGGVVPSVMTVGSGTMSDGGDGRGGDGLSVRNSSSLRESYRGLSPIAYDATAANAGTGPAHPNVPDHHIHDQISRHGRAIGATGLNTTTGETGRTGVRARDDDEDTGEDDEGRRVFAAVPIPRLGSGDMDNHDAQDLHGFVTDQAHGARDHHGPQSPVVPLASLPPFGSRFGPQGPSGSPRSEDEYGSGMDARPTPPSLGALNPNLDPRPSASLSSPDCESSMSPPPLATVRTAAKLPVTPNDTPDRGRTAGVVGTVVSAVDVEMSSRYKSETSPQPSSMPSNGRDSSSGVGSLHRLPVPFGTGDGATLEVPTLLRAGGGSISQGAASTASVPPRPVRGHAADMMEFDAGGVEDASSSASDEEADENEDSPVVKKKTLDGEKTTGNDNVERAQDDRGTGADGSASSPQESSPRCALPEDAEDLGLSPGGDAKLPPRFDTGSHPGADTGSPRAGEMIDSCSSDGQRSPIAPLPASSGLLSSPLSVASHLGVRGVGASGGDDEPLSPGSARSHQSHQSRMSSARPTPLQPRNFGAQDHMSAERMAALAIPIEIELERSDDRLGMPSAPAQSHAAVASTEDESTSLVESATSATSSAGEELSSCVDDNGSPVADLAVGQVDDHSENGRAKKAQRTEDEQQLRMLAIELDKALRDAHAAVTHCCENQAMAMCQSLPGDIDSPDVAATADRFDTHGGNNANPSNNDVDVNQAIEAEIVAPTSEDVCQRCCVTFNVHEVDVPSDSGRDLSTPETAGAATAGNPAASNNAANNAATVKKSATRVEVALPAAAVLSCDSGPGLARIFHAASIDAEIAYLSAKSETPKPKLKGVTKAKKVEKGGSSMPTPAESSRPHVVTSLSEFEVSCPHNVTVANVFLALSSQTSTIVDQFHFSDDGGLSAFGNSSSLRVSDVGARTVRVIAAPPAGAVTDSVRDSVQDSVQDSVREPSVRGSVKTSRRASMNRSLDDLMVDADRSDTGPGLGSDQGPNASGLDKAALQEAEGNGEDVSRRVLTLSEVMAPLRRLSISGNVADISTFAAEAAFQHFDRLEELHLDICDQTSHSAVLAAFTEHQSMKAEEEKQRREEDDKEEALAAAKLEATRVNDPDNYASAVAKDKKRRSKKEKKRKEDELARQESVADAVAADNTGGGGGGGDGQSESDGKQQKLMDPEFVAFKIQRAQSVSAAFRIGLKRLTRLASVTTTYAPPTASAYSFLKDLTLLGGRRSAPTTFSLGPSLGAVLRLRVSGDEPLVLSLPRVHRDRHEERVVEKASDEGNRAIQVSFGAGVATAARETDGSRLANQKEKSRKSDGKPHPTQQTAIDSTTTNAAAKETKTADSQHRRVSLAEQLQHLQLHQAPAPPTTGAFASEGGNASNQQHRQQGQEQQHGLDQQEQDQQQGQTQQGSQQLTLPQLSSEALQGAAPPPHRRLSSTAGGGPSPSVSASFCAELSCTSPNASHIDPSDVEEVLSAVVSPKHAAARRRSSMLERLTMDARIATMEGRATTDSRMTERSSTAERTPEHSAEIVTPILLREISRASGLELRMTPSGGGLDSGLGVAAGPGSGVSSGSAVPAVARVVDALSSPVSERPLPASPQPTEPKAARVDRQSKIDQNIGGSIGPAPEGDTQQSSPPPPLAAGLQRSLSQEYAVAPSHERSEIAALIAGALTPPATRPVPREGTAVGGLAEAGGGSSSRERGERERERDREKQGWNSERKSADVQRTAPLGSFAWCSPPPPASDDDPSLPNARDEIRNDRNRSEIGDGPAHHTIGVGAVEPLLPAALRGFDLTAANANATTAVVHDNAAAHGTATVARNNDDDDDDDVGVGSSASMVDEKPTLESADFFAEGQFDLSRFVLPPSDFPALSPVAVDLDQLYCLRALESLALRGVSIASFVARLQDEGAPRRLSTLELAPAKGNRMGSSSESDAAVLDSLPVFARGPVSVARLSFSTADAAGAAVELLLCGAAGTQTPLTLALSPTPTEGKAWIKSMLPMATLEENIV